MDKELNIKPATKAAVPGTVDTDLTGCMAMAFIHLCDNGLVPKPEDYDTVLSCVRFWPQRRLDPSSHIVAGLASSLPGRIADAFGTNHPLSPVNLAPDNLPVKTCSGDPLQKCLWGILGAQVNFDENCLISAFEAYGMEYPDYLFYDTLSASRQYFGNSLLNHTLPTVAEACGYDLDNHHHALADAEACAVIALQIL